MLSLRGMFLIALILLSMYPFVGLKLEKIMATSDLRFDGNKFIVHGSRIYRWRQIHRSIDVKMRIQGHRYLDYLKPRNISDLVFHYYTPVNESWINYTPTLDIADVYKIANALYNTYQDKKTITYSDALFAITYLAYSFKNQTYIQEAENYWDWLWQNDIVNHTTYFMLQRSDRSNSRPDVEMWCLYWLWKLTGKQKFYGNMTNLMQNYEYYVLKKIGYPLCKSLKTTLLRNGSNYIIDIVNGCTEYSTWTSSMRSILIFFAEKGYINSTVLALSLHNLIGVLNYPIKKRLHEAIKVYLIGTPGFYKYRVDPYDYFTPPRCHTQRISSFLWANKTLYNETTSSILKQLDLMQYYWDAGKTYGYQRGNGDLEQYGIAIAFASYLLNNTVLSKALNATIIESLVGPSSPSSWKTAWSLTIQHRKSIAFNPQLGKYIVRNSELGWRHYVNVYLYELACVLAWITGNFWIIHNPHYYYALDVYYREAVRGTPPKMYYVTDSNAWQTTLNFANRHPWNLYIIYDGARPNITLTDLILFESHPYANPYITYFSPWNMPTLGYGNFSVHLENIYVPSTRTSYIFVPSRNYHIKAIRISNQTCTKTIVIGENNYTIINDLDGNKFLVTALPDNIIVFNPLQINQNKNAVFNITVDLIEHDKDSYWDIYKRWYNVTYSNKISYAYWLCYTDNMDYCFNPDEDYDHDGVPTRYEVLFMSDPFNNDTDSDGISDAEEIYFFIDPISGDADCDGLSDNFELYGVMKWSQYINHSFDPRNTHSYNSSYYDIFYGYIMENLSEKLLLFDEFQFNETAYRCSLDTDNDLYNNYEEYYIMHTDPFQPSMIISITSPNNNDAFNRSWVLLTWLCDGTPDNFSIYKNGTLIDTIDSSITTYNVTGLTEGVWNLSVVAIDAEDNQAMDFIFIYIDFTAPIVTITNPTYGSYVNTSNITISWTGIDALSGVDYYEIRIDGGTWTNVGTNTSYTFTSVNEGSHTVDVKLHDRAGNTARDKVTFNVDLTIPMVTIIDPVNGSYFNITNVTVTWTGSDNNGIDHYEVRIDDGSWTNVGTSTNYTFSGLGEGSHIVFLRVFDIAGNIGYDRIMFIVDLAPPIVNIVNPSNDSLLSRTFIVYWNASDAVSYIDRVEVYLNGTLNATYVYGVNMTDHHKFVNLPASRTYCVKVVVYDAIGWFASDNIFVHVSLPSVSIVFPCGGYFNTQQIELAWNYSGVPDNFSIYINDTLYAIVTNTSYIIYLEEGIWNITIIAMDYAGEKAMDSTLICIDISKPKFLSIHPPNGSYINTTEIVVSWEIWDNFGIDHYEIRLDNASWLNIGINKEYTFENMAEGTHKIYLKVVDLAGNTGLYTINIIVDILPPIISIIYPSDGVYINDSTITIEFSIIDISLDHVEIRVDEKYWQNIGITTNYTITNLEDGEHTIEIKAIDKLGRETTKTIGLTADTTPPTIKNIEYAIKGDKIEVSWFAADNIGIEHYEVKIDEGPWINIGAKTKYTFWNISEGTHNILIRAYDKAGNFAEQRTSINIAESGLRMVLRLFYILLLVLAIIIVRMKMRRNNSVGRSGSNGIRIHKE